MKHHSYTSSSPSALQLRLFDLIELRHPHGKKWIYEYMEETGLKKSAVYDRRKGATCMAATEMLALMHRYQVHWYELYDELESPDIMMRFPAMERQPNTPLAFMTDLKNRLRHLIQLEPQRLYYSAAELPLFYYFSSPLITAFKLYYWSIMSWKRFSLSDKPFNEVWIQSDEIKKATAIGKEALHLYHQIPITEFWSPFMLQTTLQQIRYVCSEIQQGGSEMEATLINELEKLVDSLKTNTHDLDEQRYEVRYGTTLQIHNVALAVTPTGNQAFFVWDHPNLMTSEHTGLTQYMHAWFLHLRTHSDRINGANERIRKQFFRQLDHEISWRKINPI